MEQSCPGCPCAGFSFTLEGCVVLPGNAAGCEGVITGVVAGVTTGCGVVLTVAGALFSGAPTEISQR